MGTYLAIFVVILLGLFGVSQFTETPQPELAQPAFDANNTLPPGTQTTHTQPAATPPDASGVAAPPAAPTSGTSKPAAQPSTSGTKPATQPTSSSGSGTGASTQTQTQTQTQTTPPPATTPAPTTTTAPASVSVAIRNFNFDAKSITVKKGTTVTWTNFDSAGHTVTGDNGGPSSGFLTQGNTYSYTFNTTGTFPYHCSPHPGMQGTVTVTE